MKVYKDKPYTAHTGGYTAELNGSKEEVDTIAEEIILFIENYQTIDLYSWHVSLDVEVDLDEVRVFMFTIQPIDYMHFVVPKILEKIQPDWRIDKMAPYVYLEQKLVRVNWKHKDWLKELSFAVSPYRSQWTEYVGKSL